MIAHGWADDPSHGWIDWLQRELSKREIQATAPRFPEPKRPDIPAWMRVFDETVGQPDKGLVLVGHSLGCLIILRYLSDLASGVKIAGIVLVAGMVETANWKPPALFDPPLDFEKVKTAVRKRICIYSDDDDKVLPERTKELAGLIDADLVLDPGKGHFAGLHGCTELPSALQAVLNCYTE